MTASGSGNRQRDTLIGIASIALPLALVSIAAAGLIVVRGGVESEVADEAAFRESLARLGAFDRALIRYREHGRIETGMSKPRGIALGPSGRLYVAGEQLVRVFSRDGSKEREFETSIAATCIAVTGGGKIVVGARKSVSVLTIEGEIINRWKLGGDRAYATSVAVRGDEVVVGDAGSRVVLRYDMSGKLLARIGERDESRAVPGLVIPSPYMDVAVGSDGRIWVGNTGRHSMEAYAADGELVSKWGRASAAIDGFCGCCNPSHFALMPDGRFVTSEKGIARVKVCSARGELLAVVAGPDSFEPNILGLDTVVDRAGRVLVLDPPGGAVRIFVPVDE